LESVRVSKEVVDGVGGRRDQYGNRLRIRREQVNTESNTRAQAEAALKEHGWTPITPGCWWESELAVGRSADGEYEASLWSFADDEPGLPWRCDVGVTPPDAEKVSLWLLGIPRPEEVPALLAVHADILSVGYEGRTLDLATGRVFLEGRAGVSTLIREAKDRFGVCEAAARALYEVGWMVREVRVGLGDGPDTIVAEPKSGR
jgi:hypothetical protein